MIFIPLFFSSTASAEYIQTTRSETNQWVENLACNGYFRSGFIQTNHKSATALGGEIGCQLKINPYISAHAGIFGSFDSGINSNNDNNIQSEFFNQNQESYLLIGEAFITLNYANVNAQFGRQRFNSPFMDEDDLRIIPNLFEAYLLDYHLTDKLTLGSGYVREASGWENGANASQFVSIGEALGGVSNGAIISWLDYSHNSISNNTWFYYIPDHLTLLYTEFHHTQEISPILSYDIGFQYNWGADTGSQQLGHIDNHTFGITATLTWAKLSVTSAYNKTIGDTTALASIGGGPFFTSVEDQTLDAIEGSDSQSIMLNAEYRLTSELAIGVMAGKFSASTKADYNKEELNLYLNYSWNNMLHTEVMYAVVDDLNNAADIHQIRIILSYQY